MSVPAARMQDQLNKQGYQNAMVAKYYFAYTFYFASVASAASSTVNTQINADANFLVQALSFCVYDNTAHSQITAPLITLQITESNGTTFFDQVQPIQNIAGTGQFPFIMPEARMLTKNNSITCAITNVNSTNALQIWITMHGKKMFDYNG